MPYRPNEPVGYVADAPSALLVPSGQAEATGELVLVLRPQPGSRFRLMVAPQVTINGWSVPVHWDTNVLTAPSGRHRIQVRMRYLWTSAPVEFDAEVAVGRRTVVHYTGPWSLFAKGTLGPTPQTPRGGWVPAVLAAACLAVPLVIVLVVLLVGAVAG